MMSVSKDTAKKYLKFLFGTSEIFLSLELLFKSGIILIFDYICIFEFDFPTFVYQNAYAAIVINGVHFEIAKVPKKSPKICQN